jgi:hypothetical protein
MVTSKLLKIGDTVKLTIPPTIPEELNLKACGSSSLND